MQIFRKQFIAIISAGLMLFASLMPVSSFAADIEETPSAGAMAGDLLIARPLLLVTTVLGTALYVVSLPFTLLGGNSGEAAEVLVLDPAAATFLRCLGCENTDRADDADEDDYQASAQYSPAQPNYTPSNYNEPNQPNYAIEDAVVSTEDAFPVYNKPKARNKLTPYIKAGYQSATYLDEYDANGYSVAIGSTVLDTARGYLEAEVSYSNYGDGEIVYSDPGDPKDALTFDVTSIAAGLNAGLHAGDSGYLYAKAGYSSWTLSEERKDTDPADPSVSKGETDGADVYYGIGMGYDITNNFNFNVEYIVHPLSKIDTEENQLTSIGANLALKF